jgi:hypothetical protein
MADKKPVNQIEAPVIGATDKVKLTIPLIPGAKDQPDEFISVNGKSYLIQRGKTVTVPRYVADAYYASVRNQEKADKYYYAKAQEFSAKGPK